MNAFVHEVISVFVELSPWLLLGSLIAGGLHVLLPANFVRHHLRGRGSVLKAVGLGVPLPLCSCGVIPAGLGLKKDGASDAASVGFLISTPQTGIDSILVSAAFLGWPFALFKVGSAFITGIVGGMLTEHWGGPEVSLTPETQQSEERRTRSLVGLLEHADELLRSIWGWLAVGVLVSAAISTWLPTSALGEVTQWGSLVTMAAVLLISLPMYVCATASVPIAAALVAGGLPAGAALVFLMAGPATNVATIGAVHRGFGGRVLGIYLTTIIVGSMGLGMAFDAVLPTTVEETITHGSHATWWAMASVGILGLLMARYAWSDLQQWWKTRRFAQSKTQDAIAVSVSGMTCGGCVARLQKFLEKTEGIDRVVVTLEPGQATVKGSLDENAIRTLIEQAGFQATA